MCEEALLGTSPYSVTSSWSKVVIKDKSFDTVAECKHLGMAATNQNCICKKKLRSSHLLSANIQTKLYKTVILSSFV